MIRLVTGTIEVRKERIFQIIRENPGKGFNQLWQISQNRGKNGICARMTFKKIIEEGVIDGRIVKTEEGKQRHQYYISEGSIKNDKEYEVKLRNNLKRMTETIDFLESKNNIRKLSSFEKMAITGICYEILGKLALDATMANALVKGTGGKHNMFYKIAKQIKELQYNMIYDLMFYEDGTGDPPEFCYMFHEIIEHDLKANIHKYFKFVSKKNLKIWKEKLTPLLEK